MATCWEILELAPTEDERSIKRAYAKKLKAVHPEDDPEGFKPLR
jgi:curved DNA-binding protein CbpA